ncbi:hypothetical protein LFT45_22860 (plasmid) [Arthrobacter sp. FW305-BF8]|uniref:hypothetical protein n=1 Tax=Arthrobacter sp. FW305-BF8 TaxID=2879617 RepID=UPI001F3E2C56|nr:hypothetical protein [Arthrobacter sp. FW305-BF8]UKA56716.1 hypothetical protein LFT45_22860 [Arthrobacter sp. FW305-BF8]
MLQLSSQFLRALSCVAAAAALVAVSGCAGQVSVGNADVPAWQATALPAGSGIVAADAGKILNRQPVVQTKDVQAGTYMLTLVCEGVGKAFLTVRSAGNDLVELGAACNGAKETTKVSVTDPGPLELRASSVDAPLLYTYQLAAAR